MGLDITISRLDRVKYEPRLTLPGEYKMSWGTDVVKNAHIDYSIDIFDEVDLLCQRKNYIFLHLLQQLTPGSEQCYRMVISKLQAYHFIYVYENFKLTDVDDRKDRTKIIQEFKAILHNFDWNRHLMVWSWV